MHCCTSPSRVQHLPQASLTPDLAHQEKRLHEQEPITSCLLGRGASDIQMEPECHTTKQEKPSGRAVNSYILLVNAAIT